MSALLQKFTTEFIPEEDRLRLSCVLDEGQHVVLWLTQRLLRRLVPPLCRWLERQPVPVAVPASAHAVVMERAQVHQMALQAAQATLHQQGQVPVQASPAALSGLVQAANLQAHGGRLQLTLQAPNQGDYVMVFGPTALRQWLGIVHAHYQTAQWPLELWPQWLAQAHPASQQAPAAGLLH